MVVCLSRRGHSEHRRSYSVRSGAAFFSIVRSAEDEFKAFYNSCRHRGTKLCAGRSSGQSIKCPYHAWEWKIDGSLKHIPSHWDFRSLISKDASLREVRLGRWGGFIFVNADPHGPSLEDALSVIPDHFEGYEIESRYTAGHFRKLVRANWKITQEAFQESYHVIGTHPEAIPYNGDSQAQYDVWKTKNGHVASDDDSVSGTQYACGRGRDDASGRRGLRDGHQGLALSRARNFR